MTSSAITTDPNGHRSRVDAIDALLPQTQCTRCSYAACRPYAEAIASGEAEINQCPPGGAAGIAQLAQLLGRPVLPLNPVHGNEAALTLAIIEEQHCIGCTLCIQACPVDAIVGAPKQMHTVIAELCTGCALCLPPCPVDCIVLTPAPFVWDSARAHAAKHRYAAHEKRLAQEASEATQRAADLTAARRKKTMIAAAMERARRLRETAPAP